MKKIFLLSIVTCIACSGYAQSCSEADGFKPIQLLYAWNNNRPETNYPTIPSNWNRFYKLNEITGELTAEGCVFACCPVFAGCVCFVQGVYFRRVTPPCDPTPCGGDIPLPGMPKTDNNSVENKWSQAGAWVGGQVPVIVSSPAVVLTKSLQVDADLDIPVDHWLVLTTGSSFIAAGNTVTCNSVIRVNSAASLENFGVLKGTGQVYGQLTNSGTIAPGNSPGKFTITGNYTANNTAIHTIEIAAANIFDTISVEEDVSFASGNAVINGTLNVSLLNGYMPGLGDSYKIFTYTTSSGSFTTANLPALPVGMAWHIAYNTSDITLSVTGSILPLQFINTRAWVKEAGVQVDWTAENEMAVKEYELERSVDGRQFTRIGKVNTGINKNYTWLDANPFSGNNYYRVKAIDIDGKFMYSAILLVRMAAPTQIVIYPNPVKRSENLQISLPNKTARKIEMINTAGQTIYSRSVDLAGSFSIILPGSSPAGQYLLRVTYPNSVSTQKIQVY